MEMSVSSEMTFFTTKQQSEICPHLRTGSSAEDRGRIDTRSKDQTTVFVSSTLRKSHLTSTKPMVVFARGEESDETRLSQSTPKDYILTLFTCQ